MNTVAYYNRNDQTLLPFKRSREIREAGSHDDWDLMTLSNKETITHLTLDHCTHSLYQLSWFGSLIHLTIENSNITVLPTIPSLGTLVIKDCPHLKELPALNKLHTLKLNSTNITAIRSYPALVSLKIINQPGSPCPLIETQYSLRDCYFICCNDVQLDKFPLVKTLCIHGGSVKGGFIPCLPHMKYLSCVWFTLGYIMSQPQLKKMYCSGCTLTFLPYCPRLKKLVCDHNRLSDIPAYPRVESIDCSYNPGLKVISHMPSLKYLRNKDNKLRVIECPKLIQSL